MNGELKALVGIIGAALAVFMLHAASPPNSRATSRANGYDVLTGQPHLQWKPGMYVVAAVVGFFAALILAKILDPNREKKPRQPNGHPSWWR